MAKPRSVSAALPRLDLVALPLCLIFAPVSLASPPLSADFGHLARLVLSKRPWFKGPPFKGEPQPTVTAISQILKQNDSGYDVNFDESTCPNSPKNRSMPARKEDCLGLGSDLYKVDISWMQ